MTSLSVRLDLEPSDVHKLDRDKEIDCHYPSTTVYVVREIQANGETETRVDAFVVPFGTAMLVLSTRTTR